MEDNVVENEKVKKTLNLWKYNAIAAPIIVFFIYILLILFTSNSYFFLESTKSSYVTGYIIRLCVYVPVFVVGCYFDFKYV